MTSHTLNPTIERPAAGGFPVAELRRGALEMLPLLVGYVPFGLIVGAAVAGSVTTAAGWASTWLILGGSAQLAVLNALGAGSAVAAFVTGVLINARLLVFSTSMAPMWRRQPAWFRFVGAAVLIDPTWAAAQRRASAPGDDDQHRAYYLAAATVLVVGWSAAVAAGAVFGGGWIDGVGLTVAAPLCLAAVVAPRVRTRSTRCTAAVAVAVAVFATGLPAGAGLLIAITAGAAIGARSGTGASAQGARS